MNEPLSPAATADRIDSALTHLARLGALIGTTERGLRGRGVQQETTGEAWDAAIVLDGFAYPELCEAIDTLEALKAELQGTPDSPK